MREFLGVGEILLDCVPYKIEELEKPLYQMNTGGAVANAACVIAKLGHKASFIGRVGNDVFGTQAISSLKECGVDTSEVIVSEKDPTTLAFVCLTDDGDRSFSFYRTNTADVGMSISDLEKIDFSNINIFHFGAVSLSTEPSRSAVLYAVEKAKEKGALISYDPNLRLPLWNSPEEAKEIILKAAKYADIIKISEEEGEFLFGETDTVKICKCVEKEFNLQMFIVSQAEKGCTCSISGNIYTAKAYDVKTIDTTGAGDCFWGGILHKIIELNKRPVEMTSDEVEEMLDFANAIGSTSTTKKGAIPSIPSLVEINNCLNTKKRI